jgi:hypothetical protein
MNPRPKDPLCLHLAPEQAAVIRDSGLQFAVGLFADEAGQSVRLLLFECSRTAAVAAGKLAMHYDSTRTTPPAA